MYKIGIIGLSEGNGHPYSWAAIFNGYDKKEMAKCPFPVIPEYLGRQEESTMCIEGAKVTHIWTQSLDISNQVAKASLIENVVENMTDMIGEVDAVILARDDGENHLKMARPFIEEDIPILIDKPLTDNIDDLREFIKYYEKGKPIMSCSSARYARSIQELKEDESIGRILTANLVTPKYWRTYGIHIIEAMHAVMGGDIGTVKNIGAFGEEIVHVKYNDNRHAVLQSFLGIKRGQKGFFGENKSVFPEDQDSFYQFKSMLEAFLRMLQTGERPFDWNETIQTVKILIAAQLSLEENGREIKLEEVV